MTVTPQELVEAYEAAHVLASRHPALKQALAEYETEFEDDAPLMPVMAFALLGHAITQNWNSLSDQDRTNIFDHVEGLIRSDHKCIPDCIATGLIEALSADSDNRELDAAAAAPFLGAESKAYWIAWDKFNGCFTPGLHLPAVK